MAVIWEQGQGQEGLMRAIAYVKTGIKRSVYNALDAVKRDAEVGFEGIFAGRLDIDATANLERQVENAIANVMAKTQGIHLVQDVDIIRKASQVFKQISLDGNVYTGNMGKLELTWKGSTFDIGDMAVSYQKGPYLGSQVNRIRVGNLRKPREATVPHPHVNSEGQVCFGTWKTMMEGYARENWNWLRILVMVAEFLTYYTPEGTPYQKLSHGWRQRHLRGPRRCAECDRADSDCTCIRSGTPCPKTGDRLERIPDTNYCVGCARWATSTALANAGLPTGINSTGMCGGGISARELIRSMTSMREALQNAPRPGSVIPVDNIPQSGQSTWDYGSSEAEPTPALPTPRTPRRTTMDYMNLPMHYRKTYVFAEDWNTRTVYRCRRTTMVDDTGTRLVPMPNSRVESMNVLRVLPVEVAERVRSAGLLEFKVRLRAGMIAEVQEVLLQWASYEEPATETDAPQAQQSMSVEQMREAVEQLRQQAIRDARQAAELWQTSRVAAVRDAVEYAQRRAAEARIAERNLELERERQMENEVERNNEGGSSEVGNQQSEE